jgi:ABC-type Mn2+/Zn2+ transport system ATPase subunit
MTETALRLDRLAVGYGHRAVVKDISLELPAGQALALVGTNGSGKSTLLKTLAGLLPVVAGAAELVGGPPGRNPRRVAYLGQFHRTSLILPLRAEDVVRMGRYPVHGLLGRMGERDRVLVGEALERMGITGLKDSPLGLLSGGQQQRVYLAQALAQQAEVLLLDEPTGGLDATGRELFSRALRAERERGTAVVTATHDIREAEECDRVLLLARRVVACGPPGEALSPANLLATFGVVIRPGQDRVEVIEREHGHGGGTGEDHGHGEPG